MRAPQRHRGTEKRRGCEAGWSFSVPPCLRGSNSERQYRVTRRSSVPKIADRETPAPEGRHVYRKIFQKENSQPRRGGISRLFVGSQDAAPTGLMVFLRSIAINIPLLTELRNALAWCSTNSSPEPALSAGSCQRDTRFRNHCRTKRRERRGPLRVATLPSS